MGHAKFTEFKYTDGTSYMAKGQLDGVLIDPKLPKRFDSTANEERPYGQAKWWCFPFVRTENVADLDAWYAKRQGERALEWLQEGRQKWLEAWPTGTRYETRCLDGGAWDRSTAWGMFATLAEAVACAKTGPVWRRGD